MGIMTLWGVMIGCKPASVALGPFPATAPGHPGALRYCLGRDLIVVEAVVSEYIETRIVSADENLLKEQTRTGVVPLEIGVSLKTIADPSSVYILDSGKQGLGDLSLDVRVGDNGLLTSVEAESRSRAGEALIQIARFAGGLAGAAAAGFREAGERTGRRERRLESLSPEALFFIQESVLGRDLWQAIDRLEDELSERRDSLRGHTDAAASAGDSARFSLAQKRTSFVEDSIQFLEKEIEKARTSFSAALSTFIGSRKLGREARERTVRRHLEIKDLPPSSACEGASTEDAIASVLEKDFPRMFELYRETGLVVAFDPAIAIPEVSPPNAESLPRKNEIRIYYREAVPGMIRVFGWREGIDPVKKQFDRIFGRVDEKPAFVLHPDLPIRYAGFDRKAFSSRSVRLAVNGQGRVVGISKTSSPGLTSAASSAADSLAYAQVEIADTLGRLKELAALIEGLKLRLR